MEHLEGGAVMKRTMEPIAEKQAHSYFCNVLDGLEYCTCFILFNIIYITLIIFILIIF